MNSWGGVLSTAGGVVIFGEDSGALMAADASTGKPLWSFQTSQVWKASPMTYMFDNAQYVAVAAGSNIIAFGLPVGSVAPPFQGRDRSRAESRDATVYRSYSVLNAVTSSGERPVARSEPMSSRECARWA